MSAPAATTTTIDVPTTTVTVHLAEKTTRKALNRLKKLEPTLLYKKIETTEDRAALLTTKLVRARKELQDLETAKYHLENPTPTSTADATEGPKRKRSKPVAATTEPKKKAKKTTAVVEVKSEAEDDKDSK